MRESFKPASRFFFCAPKTIRWIFKCFNVALFSFLLLVVEAKVTYAKKPNNKFFAVRLQFIVLTGGCKNWFWAETREGIKTTKTRTRRSGEASGEKKREKGECVYGYENKWKINMFLCCLFAQRYLMLKVIWGSVFLCGWFARQSKPHTAASQADVYCSINNLTKS